jgi:lambda repressor-like predicted transcriptional regulator
MRFLREFSGIGSRPYPLDRERRRRVMVALAEKDMTISGLARSIAVSKTLVSLIINGRRRSPKTEKLIADFLGGDAGHLFPSRSAGEIKKMREREAAAKRGPA